MHALEAFPEAQNAYVGTCDEHSDQAAMWTRNPTGKLPADVWRSSSQSLPSTGNGLLMLPSSWAQKFTGAKAPHR